MKLIPIKEFEKMWKKFKGSMMYTSNNFPTYHFKNITCHPYSGPGTPFKDEYDRMMHEVLNPQRPLYLSEWTNDGIVHYYPDTPHNRKMKEERGE